MTKKTQILDELISAVASKNPEYFIQLCESNANEIVQKFESWTIVPEDIRNQPEIANLYFSTLVNIAKLFEGSGYSGLIEILAGGGDDSLDQWDKLFQEVRAQANLGDYEAALEKVEALFTEVEKAGVTGPGLLDARAKSNGLKGEILFALNRYAESRVAMVSALDDCRKNGDEEGVRIYTNNLEMLDAYDPIRPELVDIELNVLQTFSNARRLTDLGRFHASNRVLSELLTITGDATQFVEAIQSQILGRKGFNEFKLDNHEAAQSLFAKARDLCIEQQDERGVEVYSENILAVKNFV